MLNAHMNGFSPLKKEREEKKILLVVKLKCFHSIKSQTEKFTKDFQEYEVSSDQGTNSLIICGLLCNFSFMPSFNYPLIQSPSHYEDTLHASLYLAVHSAHYGT